MKKTYTNICCRKVSEHIKTLFQVPKEGKTTEQRFKNENGIQFPQTATLGSERQ